MERQATALIGRCYAGLDAAGLGEEVLRRLRRMLPVDAAFFATVDPMTLLFTWAVADEPLSAARPLFLDNEFGRDDVNKFAALAESADPVASLDRATRGQRPASARYREIMGPLGLGDELRAALVTKNGCWGVLCLHRQDASHGFDAREIDLLRHISPHVAEGLRRAVTIGPVAPIGAEAAVPGMIVLDANLAVVSMTKRPGGGWRKSARPTGRAPVNCPFPFTPPPPGWFGEDGPATAPAACHGPASQPRRTVAVIARLPPVRSARAADRRRDRPLPRRKSAPCC